ncbi:MAG: hypothetical protein QOJ16_4039 [Acidobacteriota bacterium]|nr:hypothetical protein [Acidobacteriota bacterium]
MLESLSYISLRRFGSAEVSKVKTILISALLLVLTLVQPAPVRAAWETTALPRALESKIVNGFTTSDYPSVGLFLNGQIGCTATLIGCSTAITAAHCVCSDLIANSLLTGADCVKRTDLLNPATKTVYFHQAGLVAVSSVTVNPAFNFAQESDLAILHLAAPVTGITPSPINTAAKPAFGTPAVLVGFGVTEDTASGAGIKRTGAATVATCGLTGINKANHLCINFNPPLGTPGVNSGTCHGDSGGPLFVNTAAGPTLAGTTSGGDSADPNCAAPNHLFFADVFRDRAWIQANASDLGTVSCGGLAGAGGLGTVVASAGGSLFPTHPSEVTPINVPPGTTRLRAGLTADNFSRNDYNLYLKQGTPPTTTSFDCKNEAKGTLAFCDVPNPAAGPWYALVNGIAGPGGEYQLVTTTFGPAALPAPCVPAGTTLCLDDKPGDRRFKVEVLYQTAQGGGLAGSGNAIPLASLGVNRGGLFWFFAPDNPEMLIKVLNACTGTTLRYWVFYSAGTNVGLAITVTDTVTGHVKTYSNPDLRSVAPVTDTDALPCS